MATIYIRDPETVLAVDATYFTLRCKGRRVGRIPPTMVEQVTNFRQRCRSLPYG